MTEELLSLLRVIHGQLITAADDLYKLPDCFDAWRCIDEAINLICQAISALQGAIVND